MPSPSTPAAHPAHSSAPPDRHRRLCAVCRHPQREMIEEAFLRWENVQWITDNFKLPDRASLYRHAHAMNLFPRREANLRFALGRIIEQSECVQPTAFAVIAAVRAYAHIDDTGCWIKPPTTHYVLSAPPKPRKRASSNRNTPGNQK